MNTQEVVTVVAGIVLVAILANEWRRVSSRDSEKRDRWRRLPIRFKFACWFVVIPLFCLAGAAPFVHPNWVGGFVMLASTSFAWLSMAIVEGRAVAWYRAHGLLPELEDEDATEYANRHGPTTAESAFAARVDGPVVATLNVGVNWSTWNPFKPF